MGPSQPRNQTSVSYTGRWILYHWATREALNEVLMWGQCVPEIPVLGTIHGGKKLQIAIETTGHPWQRLRRLVWVTMWTNIQGVLMQELTTFVADFHIYMEKAMAPNSNTLAWKIPWTEEPGKLLSMGSRNPWSRGIPHATEQLSPCAATTKTACCNYWNSNPLELVFHNKRSRYNEKPSHCN